MCSGDTLKYKTINAATYEKKGIARALNWYFRFSNKNKKSMALCQAYIWACGHGANKQDTVYQAGKNVDKGYSQKDAKKFCETISDQDPEGTIYYYTVKKCVKKEKTGFPSSIVRIPSYTANRSKKQRQMQQKRWKVRIMLR